MYVYVKTKSLVYGGSTNFEGLNSLQNDIFFWSRPNSKHLQTTIQMLLE